MIRKNIHLAFFLLVCLAVLIPQIIFAQAWPTAEITPDPMEFPDTLVGSASADETFTITNTSSSISLYIFSAKLADTSSFQIAQDNCTGVFIEPSSTCTIDISFEPASAGQISTSISIINIGKHVIDSAGIKGKGVEPAVTLSASSVDFGDHVIGRRSEGRIVTLTNTGSSTLNIDEIGATGLFDQTNDCGSSVEPSSSCDITITFTPTATGEFTGEVTITDDAPNSPQTISLEGKGVDEGEADAGLSKTSLDFGNQLVGTVSDPLTVTLTNTGTINLTVDQITASGNFAQTNTCGDLAPDAQCNISITFTPPAEATYSGTVTIDDNASDSPQTIALTGAGFEQGGPEANLSASSVDFEEILVDHRSDPQTVTLTNGGGTDLIIYSVEIVGNDSGDFSETDSCTGSTISPNESCNIQMTFTPASTGRRSAVVNIDDDAGDSPQSVSVLGFGQAGTGGGCSLIPVR